MAAEGDDAHTIEFRLPSLGSDMDYGTVVRWRVAVGDEVRSGDVLLDVDTEKSEIEVEIWHDAVVAEILVGEGEEVPVGTALALVTVSADVETPLLPPGEPAPGAPARPTETAPDAAPSDTPAASGLDGPFPTPRMVFWPADPSGRRPPRPTPASRPQRRQAAVAALMERSNREIPHFHLTADIDMRPGLDWLETVNEARTPPERILPAALLLRATALAAAAHPSLNGTWVDGAFAGSDHVQLGVAVHIRGGGLMTPVLAEAEAMELDTLMVELRELVGRARAGRLRGGDITDPTLTVSNVGDGGADALFGVIRPPQVALVGFGRIREELALDADGTVVPRPTLTATLSADHRANNGQTGAAFLATVAAGLEAPDSL